MSGTYRMFCRALTSAELICSGINPAQEKQRDAVCSHLLSISLLRNKKSQTSQHKKKTLNSKFPKEKLTLKGAWDLDLVQESNLRSSTALRSTHLSEDWGHSHVSYSWTLKIHTVHHFPTSVQILSTSLALEGLLGFHLRSSPNCIKILKPPTQDRWTETEHLGAWARKDSFHLILSKFVVAWTMNKYNKTEHS